MPYDQPIGILGGTFDPIHNAHIALANEIQSALNLARVHFIPNNTPPHRQPTLANAQQRLTMVKLALAAYPNFICDDTDIKRGGTSYMIDTLLALRQQYPNTPLCLLLGADVFAQLNTWHRWEELLAQAHIICIARKQTKQTHSNDIQQLLHCNQTDSIEDLQRFLAGKIYCYSHEISNLSATQIREKLKTNADVSRALPGAVIEYIRKHQLYSHSLF